MRIGYWALQTPDGPAYTITVGRPCESYDGHGDPEYRYPPILWKMTVSLSIALLPCVMFFPYPLCSTIYASETAFDARKLRSQLRPRTLSSNPQTPEPRVPRVTGRALQTSVAVMMDAVSVLGAVLRKTGGEAFLPSGVSCDNDKTWRNGSTFKSELRMVQHQGSIHLPPAISCQPWFSLLRAHGEYPAGLEWAARQAGHDGDRAGPGRLP